MQGCRAGELGAIKILDRVFKLVEPAPTGSPVHEESQSELELVAEAREAGFAGGLRLVLAPQVPRQVRKGPEKSLAGPILGLGLRSRGQQLAGGPRPIAEQGLGAVVHDQKSKNTPQIDGRLDPGAEGQGHQGRPVAVAGDALRGPDPRLEPSGAGQVFEPGQGHEGLQAAFVGGIHGPQG